MKINQNKTFFYVRPATGSKGHTCDWQWLLGSHAADSNRQNLDHIFPAFVITFTSYCTKIGLKGFEIRIITVNCVCSV